MAPFIALLATTAALRVAGALGVAALDGSNPALRGGLAAMLLVGASGHMGVRRADLVAMVPPALPRPDLLVTATGIAEALLAAALLVEPLAAAAALATAALLVVLFPANVRAARLGLTIGGRAATPLPARAAMQAAFVAAALAVPLL